MIRGSVEPKEKKVLLDHQVSPVPLEFVDQWDLWVVLEFKAR